MDVAAEPAPREQSPRPDTNVDVTLYFKLKTTLEVIFVSGWGEFITQYQFNELDERMPKLEKGQTVTKTARDSRGTRRRDEHGRRTHWQVHHSTSISCDGQEVKGV